MNEAERIIMALSKDQKGKLVNGLNSMSFDDVATLRGIGVCALRWMFYIRGNSGTTVATNKRVWEEQGKPLPTFYVALTKRVVFEVYYGEYKAVRALHTNVNRIGVLSMIEATGASKVPDLRATLEKLRGLRSDLELLTTANDPLINDYLGSIRDVLTPEKTLLTQAEAQRALGVSPEELHTLLLQGKVEQEHASFITTESIAKYKEKKK